MPEPEETVVPEEKEDSWDKERQRVDQLAANVTKMASDKAELASQLSAMTERSQEMLNKVSELEAQLSTAQIARDKESDNLDEDMYDDKLIKKISKFETEISNTKKLLEDSNKQVKELMDAKAKWEQDAADEAEAARKAARKEKILSDLDKEFGPKYRNEALKLAQAEVDQNGKAPEGEYEVARLLRKHYRELSKPSDKKTFPSVTVDTGDGGVVFNDGDIEEGSRDEVLASIASKIKGKPFTMPKT
jgi:chromosome segregation ATPase